MVITKEVAAGINDEELTSLSEEILKYVDNISSILERLDRSIERLPGCYRGEASDKLMRRYSEIESSFSVLESNLRSYSEDLKALIVKMKEGDQSLSRIFQEATNDAQGRLRAAESDFNLK